MTVRRQPRQAWHFQFGNLADLAGAVLAAKTVLVNKVEEFRPKYEDRYISKDMV